MNECRFELKPLHCSSCGAWLGTEGTCEDEANAFCGTCAGKQFGSLKTDVIWQPNYDNLGKDGEPKTFKATRIGKGGVK